MRRPAVRTAGLHLLMFPTKYLCRSLPRWDDAKVMTVFRRFRATPLVCCLSALPLLGCGSGSMKAEASGKASTEGGAQGRAKADNSWVMDDDSPVEDAPTAGKVGDATKASGGVTPAPKAAPVAEKEPTLLGARRDLSLAKGTAANCRCVAAAIGAANSPAFVWTGTAPELDPATQMIVALSSEGIACADSSAVASYHGYRVEGSNVFVSVEAAHPGRPLTHGAVIPKPAADGKVFLESFGKVPFGKGPKGEARCAVGP